jgi:hypothetical protein
MAGPNGKKTGIGWTEYVDLPDWAITGLHAKIDTGARTSALHVEDLTPLPDGWVLFHVILSRKHAHQRVEVRAPVTRWGRVRSSTGHYSTRCFVTTRVRLGPVVKEIEISLISRERMLYRMLLGRQALAKDFVVDVSRRHVMGGKPKAARRRTRS